MNFDIAMTESLHQEASTFLLEHIRRGLLQEQACLALWRWTDGERRRTAVLVKLIKPARHQAWLTGNVTLTPDFLTDGVDQAEHHASGLAVLHSHFTPGWQPLSRTDYRTEQRELAPFVFSTGFPLLGMTLGTDGTWSGRVWEGGSPRGWTRPYAASGIRIVGPSGLRISRPPSAYLSYTRQDAFKRTVDCWGWPKQRRLGLTHIALVGCGSVGSLVAEALARMGVQALTLVDSDHVEVHNLDRLVHASRSDIGRSKVDLVKSRLEQVATAGDFRVHAITGSIEDLHVYRQVCDADLVVNCVDNAPAREAINYLAYANLVPVVEGGVEIESPDGEMRSARERVQVAGPELQCLLCSGQYTTADVTLHRLRRAPDSGYFVGDASGLEDGGRNAFPFCLSLSAALLRSLLSYVIGEDWWDYPLASEYRYFGDEREDRSAGICKKSCRFQHVRLGLGARARPPLMLA